MLGGSTRRGSTIRGAGAAAVALALAGAASAATAPRSSSPGRATGRCANAEVRGLRYLHIPTAAVTPGTAGRVLPRGRLQSQLPNQPPYVSPNPQAPHYPNGQLPQGQPSWRNIAGVPASHLIYSSGADAIFNADRNRYRIAFNQSYYGVDPTFISNFAGHGVDALVIPDHYAFVDGMYEAGEVDVYYARPGRRIDPRRDVPDLIFYGDEAGGKLGISVASVGDVNGDGYNDLLISAAFHSAPGPNQTRVQSAGIVYLVYGGAYLHRFRCPIKIRSSEIGRRIPGIVFYGGLDGGRYTGWDNELDGGDFSGNGLSDLIIGSYDPYRGSAPTFPARAYLIYGSRRLPRRFVGYRLGVDTNQARIRSTVYTFPDGELTRAPSEFTASFAGDLTGNGHDDLAFSGANNDYIFFGPAPGKPPSVPIQSAPLTIYPDTLSSPALQFDGLQGVRPNGDIYGDGHQDALLVARYTRAMIGGSWQVAGAVGVLRGRRSFPAKLGFSQLDTIIYGDQPGQVGQPSMATGADFDGDGCTDILINDTYYTENIGGIPQERGRMWLLRGRSNLPHLIDLEPSANRIILSNNRFPGLFGFNWATGLFGWDARPALVVADHYSGDRELHDFAGRTYLFYNRSLHVGWGRRAACRARKR